MSTPLKIKEEVSPDNVMNLKLMREVKEELESKALRGPRRILSQVVNIVMLRIGLMPLVLCLFTVSLLTVESARSRAGKEKPSGRVRQPFVGTTNFPSESP
jgi:hypothetical protein